VDITIPDFKLGQDNKTAEFLKLSPLGKVPVLQTPSGAIFESNAISRYVARLRRDTELTGASFFDSAQVDSWIDFCSHDLELPASIWFYPVLGYMPYNEAATANAKSQLARALTVLNNHLADNTYLVGNKVTLADITVVSALVYPFKFVCDAAYRGAFPHVNRWFETCVNQPQFAAVIGTVVLCTKEMTANGAPVVAASAPAGGKKGGNDGNKKEKKEKAPQESKPKETKPKEAKKEAAPAPKKEKEEEEDFDDAPKEKKTDHPFKIMDKENPSPFVMDTWKKTYSNCDGDYVGAMNSFWETFDPAGWSLWRGDYNYDNENKVLFMTGNLLGGFIQRTEEIRKWLFGTMTIRGVEGLGTMKITCYYLIRGQEIAPLIKCNDDAEYYTWTKVNVPVSDADKALIFEYWTSETTLEGMPCLDNRCYK